MQHLQLSRLVWHHLEMCHVQLKEQVVRIWAYVVVTDHLLLVPTVAACILEAVVLECACQSMRRV